MKTNNLTRGEIKNKTKVNSEFLQQVFQELRNRLIVNISTNPACTNLSDFSFVSRTLHSQKTT